MITSQINYISYVPNGVTTVFAVPYRFLNSSHVLVMLTDSEGNRETLVSGFTITGENDPSGGECTFDEAPEGTYLEFQRNTPMLQEVDYVNNDAFQAESHEKQMDRTIMALQDKELALRFLMESMTITIGTVETLPAGQDATAEITGTFPNYVLNLGLPTGATGSIDGGPDATFGTTPNHEGGPALTLYDFGTETFKAIWLQDGVFVSGTFS